MTRAGALALGSLMILGACAGATPTPQIIYVTQPPATVSVTTPPAEPTAAPMETIVGTIATHGPARDYTDGLPCTPPASLAAVKPGAAVVVRDEASKVIGSDLVYGGAAPGTTAPGHYPLKTDECDFTYSVQVPTTAFYSVTVADLSAFTVSHDELVRRGWHLDLSFGP